MESIDSNEYLPEKRARILRVELKEWEKEFSARNNGKIASREDIKQNSEIATKYKEYYKIRGVRDCQHSSNISQENGSSRPRAKKHEDSNPNSVSQRERNFQTPIKRYTTQGEGESPKSHSVIRKLFTPSKTSLGPTPQKNGKVLGLFDLLKESQIHNSPKAHEAKVPYQRIPTVTHTTPLNSYLKEDHSSLDLILTPASSGKRRKVEIYSTPLKNSNCALYEDATPVSVSKLDFSTPTYLRRDNAYLMRSSRLEENLDQPLSPPVLRTTKKRLPAKGLTSILADLREIQDENLDLELEALRELETEEKSGVIKNSARKTNDTGKVNNQKETISNHRDSLSLNDYDLNLQCGKDFVVVDHNREISLSTTAQKTLDDQGVKLFKKKGQKRTTRKVNLKPTPLKRPLHPVSTIIGVESKYMDDHTSATTLDSNLFANADDKARNFDSDSQSEYTASEGETRYRRPNQSHKKEMRKENCDNQNSINAEIAEIKTLNRKSSKVSVKSISHQNFRRLKLRNSGAAGARDLKNSRFRRNKR